jgi:hypothetical protein
MSTKIKDIQRIKSTWIWIIAIVLNFFTVYGLITQIGLKIPFGSNPAPNLLLIGFFISTLLLLIFLLIIRLKILFTEESVIIEFYPFYKKVILLTEIKQMEIVTYNPIKDYGGWGIRYGKKGRAITLSGNLGLSLTLMNNENILIGITNKQKFKSLNLPNHENI